MRGLDICSILARRKILVISVIFEKKVLEGSKYDVGIRNLCHKELNVFCNILINRKENRKRSTRD